MIQKNTNTTHHDKGNSRRKGKTPTAWWREEVDGDGQMRDAGNDEA